MKTVAIIFLVLAIANAELLSPKFKQFMQLKEKAGNAVDAVMDVLNGLRQSALDERTALDASHDAAEAAFAKRIGELTSIMNTNRGIYDAAVANRVFVEQEITDTGNYMAWIENRFVEINAMTAELHSERCDASLIFVQRCREHYEALDTVELLKQDLTDWQAAGMPVNFAEIKNMGSFNKLSAYTHLFKKQALDNFLSLAAPGPDDTRRRTAGEVGDDHVDNTQGAVALEHQVDETENVAVSVVQRLLHKLDEFVVHLHASMDDLIAAEVRAGRDTVTFVQESEKETHVLQMELDRRTAYATKLENDLVLAQAHEASTLATYENSVAAVEAAKAELQEHRDFYMSEVDRLRNDVEVVDEVISIFLQELQGIDDIIRNQQYDEVGVVDDDRFSQGVFRNVDQTRTEYTGQGGWEAQTAR